VEGMAAQSLWFVTSASEAAAKKLWLS